MGNTRILMGLGAFVVMIVAGFFISQNQSKAPQENPVAELPPYEVGAVTKSYRNEEFNFSLKTPEEFGVKEAKQEDGTMVTIEDTNGNGIQILVSPFEEPIKVLTAERIEQDVPDLKIDDTQPLDIGEEYKGVAFKSDNPAFDGASREVWFLFPKCEEGVCENQLYQISTYERLDPLLKAIFATWDFF